MVLSAQDYDLTQPLSSFERTKLALWTVGAKWRWRKYANEDRQFISRMKQSGIPVNTIWDIGASNGAWALMAAGHFPNARLEMFEPLVAFDKNYYDVMRYRLSKNSNWHLHPFALSSQVGEAVIYVADHAHGSSLVNSEYAEKNWRKINVRTSTMDDMIDNEGVEVPDVLKADTQGFELEVLKGGKKNINGLKVLLLECWLSRAYGSQTPLLEEIMEWLKPHGFVLAEVNAGYRDASGLMHSVDAFFLHKDVAKKAGLQTEITVEINA